MAINWDRPSPIMALCNRLFLVLIFTLVLAPTPLAAQSITVTIIRPQSSEKAGDSLGIQATVSSTYQLQTVTATVADRTANLSWNPSLGRWEGTLSLVGLPRGPLLLTVTAQDIFGSTGSAQVTFVHDRRPQITITTPMSESVARPVIHVTATCTDDDPAGCVSLIVRRESPNTEDVLITATSHIDQDLSLDAFEGLSFNLEFIGTDSGGQTVSEKRFVYVDSSRRLQEFHNLTGRIVDVQPNRILYLDETGTFLKIRDIASSTDTNIPAVPSKLPRHGSFLTPRGAIFVASSADTVLDASVYEWQDSTLLDHGYPNSTLSLDTAGPYAIWTGSGQFVRNIVTATTTEVPFSGPGNIGNIHNDVAEDGTVAFWTSSPYNIYLYKNGSVLPLTANPNGVVQWDIYPRTDSTNTLYKRRVTFGGCCAPSTWAIMRHDGVAESEIAAPREGEPEPDLDYQVRNGWIAVTRSAGGSGNPVWRRSPAGQEEQLSFFAAFMRIDYLSADGELTFNNMNSRQRFLSRVPAAGAGTFRISSTLGRSYPIDDDWYVAIGRSLFLVSQDPSAATTTTLSHSPTSSVVGEAVTFTATVAPGGATGIVAFRDGDVTIASSPLSGGIATFTTSSLATGVHTIRAVYGGDPTFEASTSPPLSHQVRLASSTTLTSSPNPSDPGQSVTLTATVSGSGVSGQVAFYDGDTVIGTQPINSGTAVLVTSSLSAGSHPITAKYLGDENYAPSQSSVLVQQVRSSFGPPAGVSATATSTSQAVVTWVPVLGATEYEIARSFHNGPFLSAGLVSGTTFTENGLTANTTYLYAVRAIASGGEASVYSNVDAATTVTFTDDPLAPQVHLVKRAHVMELRTAVNAMRASIGLLPASFTDSDLPAGTLIRAIHMNELRTALDQARASLGLPALTHPDPSLTPGVTTIKTAHFQELRDGCK